VLTTEVYGRDKALRGFCEQHRVGYVFGVPCSFTVVLTSGRRVRADQAAETGATKGVELAQVAGGGRLPGR
jgi:hypothetical protein